jgi:hypothetical protein
MLLAAETIAMWPSAGIEAPATSGAAPIAAVDPSAAPPKASTADAAAILSRPLFNWNRRPSAASPGTQPDAPLPRLSGIMIGANQRYAFFAGQGSKPLVVPEGGAVGRFTIDKITPDHVDISGDIGPRRLQTRFDQRGPPAESLHVPRTGSNE